MSYTKAYEDDRYVVTLSGRNMIHKTVNIVYQDSLVSSSSSYDFLSSNHIVSFPRKTKESMRAVYDPKLLNVR